MSLPTASASLQEHSDHAPRPPAASSHNCRRPPAAAAAAACDRPALCLRPPVLLSPLRLADAQNHTVHHPPAAGHLVCRQPDGPGAAAEALRVVDRHEPVCCREGSAGGWGWWVQQSFCKSAKHIRSRAHSLCNLDPSRAPTLMRTTSSCAARHTGLESSWVM